MDRQPQHLSQGALPQPDGGVVWRVWAPQAKCVRLISWHEGRRDETAMTPEEGNYFVCRKAFVEEGLRYEFALDDGDVYPDPASRWQPDDVHRPSAVFFAGSYPWSDQGWRGLARERLVVYELHVGTFTPEGTFEAILPRLPELASLGITALELMPVAQFPGQRNWGYDGVYPYAVHASYGGPPALQRLVDAAHAHGLAMLLDVVYNHLGPEGNYLGRFGPYFTDRYRTPWGTAINFDGADSDAVRQYFIDNACMWVRDFHFDGLRLDAVHAIYDFSPRHILADMQRAVQEEAARHKRIVHLIAESNQNDVRLVRPLSDGGYGLDGVWSDDFHHSVHALLTGERGGYYLDFGSPAHLAEAFGKVFVYDGGYSSFRRRRHGSPVGVIDRAQFLVCIQNHDQIGNRARGERLAALLPAEQQRLACALLLLSPCLPLLFMGEEYGETTPFPFFCSFADARLAAAVRDGRREECAAFHGDVGSEIPDPQDPHTFLGAKLTWDWPEGSSRAGLRRLYQDLLTARRTWPALLDRQHTVARLIDLDVADGSSGASALLVLERGTSKGLVALANLTSQSAVVATLNLDGCPEVLSTEDIRYGGGRSAAPWSHRLLPYELLVLDRGGARP